MLRCLTFPNPFLCAIPIAAEASAFIQGVTLHPYSSHIAASPSPSDAAVTVAYSSASADDSATVLWVRDYDFNRCAPYRKHAPEVERLVLTHPAQSESV